MAVDVSQWIGTLTWSIAGIVFMGGFALCFILIKDIIMYNKYVDAWKMVGGNYKLFRTKGAIKKNKNGVKEFVTRKFGKDGNKINYRDPDGIMFADFEKPLLTLPFLPTVKSEQIAFVNPVGDVWIPVRRSFISIKRGINLSITNHEECEFCNNKVDMTKFIEKPSLFTEKIKNMNNVCEKCFTKLINARYECIDQSDLSWMWKEIDGIKHKYGDFITKFLPAIVIGGSFIFAIAVIVVSYQMHPDINEGIATAYSREAQAYAKAAIEINQGYATPTE